ncbi:MAG: HAD-IA family hydrolase [Marinilabiliales bacterium]|nr:HAD-IA family hydrolase [Marinilabiliales bacterium]
MQTLKLPASDYERVRDEFFAGDVIDHEILNFLRSIKPKYQNRSHQQCLERTAQLHRAREVRRRLPPDGHLGWRSVWQSPTRRSIHIALEQLQVKAKEAVFVDDVLENIEACEQVGMQGIHFKGSRPSVIEQIRSML